MENIHIKIPEPKWGSELANIIIILEKLRVKILWGSVPPHIFFQLKNIFQILENLGSARIEGNNTTLSEYVEKIIEDKTEINEKEIEIANLEKAIIFIEENVDENFIFTRAFFSELHKIITHNLSPPPNGEGSRYPGELRKINVSIAKSRHNPPDYISLPDYFEEFLNFINQNLEEQYQLLMVAIAHHRFTWIHPYDNGNGRIVRLLTYALLIKLGFQVKNGRIINPSAVFYTDRDKYYKMLEIADKLDEQSLLKWAQYFLLGLKNEIEKIDSLLSMKYVREKILIPAINFALERQSITQKEYKILKYLIQKDDVLIKSEELNKIGINNSVQKSRAMKTLRDKKMVKPNKENGRIYTINFINNYLLRGVIDSLDKQGFISDFLK